MKKLILIAILFIFICYGCSDRSPYSCDDYYIDITQYDVVEPPESMKVFVVIGQSNASGSAELLPEDMDTFENIYLLVDDASHWIKAQNPFNQFSNIQVMTPQLNFAYSFALELVKAYPDESFGFVVNARGGSGIECWQKRGECYECTLDRVLTVPHDIIGVLVHQGESNWPDLYWLNCAANLIEDFRLDIGYHVPFVFGEIASWNPHYVAFNKRLAELPLLVSDVKIVQSDGLTGTGLAHFDRESQLELGIRYFDAYCS